MFVIVSLDPLPCPPDVPTELVTIPTTSPTLYPDPSLNDSRNEIIEPPTPTEAMLNFNPVPPPVIAKVSIGDVPSLGDAV